MLKEEMDMELQTLMQRNYLSDTDRSVAKINHKDKVLSGYLETGYDLKKNDFIDTICWSKS